MAIEYKEAQTSPIKQLRDMLKSKPVQYFAESLVVVVAEGKSFICLLFCFVIRQNVCTPNIFAFLVLIDLNFFLARIAQSFVIFVIFKFFKIR